MDRINQSSVTGFLLLGLSERPEQQPLLFGIFLGMYLVTVMGNLLIILAIGFDPHLHTPMYFFLANLSFADGCFSSTIVPRMLVNIRTHNQTISYGECLAQMYFFMMFGGLDDFLLGVMAYDRYVAICKPLHYSTLMSPLVCVLMLTASWVLTNLAALLHTLLMARLSFCAGNTIHHFFCDVIPLLQLSCSDTCTNQPQEQGYEDCTEKAFWNSHFLFTGTLMLHPYFDATLWRTLVFMEQYHPLSHLLRS
nr:olfactory receptor 1N2-like [Equus asinus]